MLFWVLCAVLTAAVLYAVTRPLSAPALSPADDGDAASDIAVYRDQLQELDADRARGLLADAEAEGARVEISRRLLAIARTSGAGHPGRSLAGSTRVRRALFASAAVLVPVLSLALYLANGSPGLPGQPYAARAAVPVEKARIDSLVAQVEARLRDHPEDGEGWDVIAPVYLRQGRFTESAQAYQRAIRLLGETPRRLAGFGEATVFAGNGIVTEEARRAFEKLAQIEPGQPAPRFWLALAKEQDGDLAGALEGYRKLAADAPREADWRPAVDERITMLTKRIGGSRVPAGTGPTADDMAAAEKLAPADRAAMVEQMVEGLARRLEVNAQDLAGWQRLLRAYAVLGRKDKAANALERARRAFATDGASRAALDDLARSLGLDS
ncbi:MAG: c-type cytochrome biogenesis protein CcmI [Hyphomicrobiaceae bacterium]|nr:c-type cytochrome biogenesis protein CcmI [Hyphomicrobiaceae bacterium]